MTESEIQARIMLALGARPDIRIFRNTVGQGWMGQVIARDRGPVILQHGDVVLRQARPVTFGLATHSPDIVGWQTIEIGGQRVARFLGLEVKTPAGRASDGQVNFLNRLNDAGALGALVRSVDDAVAAVRPR